MKNKFLFFGPEGCGKTIFAKGLFAEIEEAAPGRMHMEVKVSGVLHNPEKGIKQVFEAVERFALSGLLIENIDELFVFLRNYPGAWRYLIDQMRDKQSELLVIGTTRKPEKLGEEEIEAFSTLMPFLYPSQEDRLAILRLCTVGMELDDAIDLEEIVVRTHLWTSEELTHLILPGIKSENRELKLTKIILEVNYDKIGEMVNPKAREKRLHELLTFASNHVLPNGVRSQVLTRFEEVKQFSERVSSLGRNKASLHTGSMFIVNTDGGAYIAGNVNVDGDFIGRDSSDSK